MKSMHPIKVGENDRLDIFGKVLGKSDASAITGTLPIKRKSFLSDTLFFCIMTIKKISIELKGRNFYGGYQ